MALLFSPQNTKMWVYLQSNNHSFIHSLKYLLKPRQVRGQQTFSVKGQRIKKFKALWVTHGFCHRRSDLASLFYFCLCFLQSFKKAKTILS